MSFPEGSLPTSNPLMYRQTPFQPSEPTQALLRVKKGPTTPAYAPHRIAERLTREHANEQALKRIVLEPLHGKILFICFEMGVLLIAEADLEPTEQPRMALG